MSPKVYFPLLIQVIAAVALYAITKDSTVLITLLSSAAATGVIGGAVPPAPNVDQTEVNRISRGRR